MFGAYQANTMYTTGERIREKETNSVELGPWLDDFDNKKKIYNMRLFYVVEMSMFIQWPGVWDINQA